MQPVECGALLATLDAADPVIDEFSDDTPAAPLDRGSQLAPLVLFGSRRS